MSEESKKKEISADILEKAEKKLGATRAKLLLKNPFFGVLLSMTDFIREDSLPTLATDGTKIYYNPTFVARLNDAEVYGVCLHEISHCIYLHCNPKRRLNREQHKWNISIDYAINIEIKDMGYTLPQGSGILLDERFRNHNAEMIYDMLPKDVSKMSTFDVHIEPSDGTVAWDDMEDKILSVYEMTKDDSKEAGKLPGGLKKWIEKIKKSKVKWERIFHRYVGQALAKDDYSYIRPNRRYISQDLYLPDLRNYKLGKLCVAVDTSGSISDRQLEDFAAELYKINYLIEETIVITCDADIQNVYRVKKLDPELFKKIQFNGRGGTSFIPPFDYIEKEKEPIELFIYFTDSYGSCPQKAPKYPVIWLYTDLDSPHQPWGHHVHMPNDKMKNDY